MKHYLLILFAVLLAAGCGTQASVSEPLTPLHGGEVKRLIETYFSETGSLDAQFDHDRYAQVATGPMLKSLMEFGTPQPDTEIFVTRSIEIKEVHVIEYTNAQIKAVACGQFELSKVKTDGTETGTLTPQFFNSIFVFRRENETWKLYTFYPIGDPKSALRDWDYDLSGEERAAIGDLQWYLDQYSTCGL